MKENADKIAKMIRNISFLCYKINLYQKILQKLAGKSEMKLATWFKGAHFKGYGNDLALALLRGSPEY
jgi:hypothetical protein